MITCAITAESKRALRKAIGSILTERINQKSKFDLKDITKDAAIPQDHGWSTGISVVDINNDGLLDIYR